MNGDDVVRRLKAYAAGKPLPVGDTIHFPLPDDEDVLIVAFVKMGGESRPWGIAFGRPGVEPTILTVPEARDRDLVAAMMAEFAPTLLAHLRHPKYADDSPNGPEDVRPLRQVWVPNPTHADMLHFLAYAYTFARQGPAERVELLNALGRACGWLFREARRPGQVTLLEATAALTESYTFPAETVRQGHLGFLLAWLETRGELDARQRAASAAERDAIATALDPALERAELEPLVDRHNTAEQTDDKGAMERASRDIRKVLEPELRRRFELVERTITHLRNDRRRVNAGVEALARVARAELWFQYLRLELQRDDEADGPAFTPSPETDRHPAAAAARYTTHEASADLHYCALVHDDREMQEQAIAQGDAFRAVITRVEDEDPGRKTIPIWTLEGEGDTPLRLREESHVCVAGLPQRTGRIRSIEPLRDGHRRYVVQITGCLTTPRNPTRRPVRPACDTALVGTEVVLVRTTAEGLLRAKSRRVWKSDVPGAWLTHAVPRGPRAELPEDVAEEMPATAGQA